MNECGKLQHKHFPVMYFELYVGQFGIINLNPIVTLFTRFHTV